MGSLCSPDREREMQTDMDTKAKRQNGPAKIQNEGLNLEDQSVNNSEYSSTKRRYFIFDRLLIYGYLRKHKLIYLLPNDLVHPIIDFWGCIMENCREITLSVSEDYMFDNELCESFNYHQIPKECCIIFEWPSKIPAHNLTILHNGVNHKIKNDEDVAQTPPTMNLTQQLQLMANNLLWTWDYYIIGDSIYFIPFLAGSDPTLDGKIPWRKVADFTALLPRDVKSELWNGIFPNDADKQQHERKKISKVLRTFVMLYLTRDYQKRNETVPDDVKSKLAAAVRIPTYFIAHFLKKDSKCIDETFQIIHRTLCERFKTDDETKKAKYAEKEKAVRDNYAELTKEDLKDTFNEEDFLKTAFVQYMLYAAFQIK